MAKVKIWMVCPLNFSSGEYTLWYHSSPKLLKMTLSIGFLELGHFERLFLSTNQVVKTRRHSIELSWWKSFLRGYLEGCWNQSWIHELSVCRRDQEFKPVFAQCCQTILILRVLWEKSKGNGKALFCAFIDFKKVFDTVSRKLSWERLQDIGVPLNLLGPVIMLCN